MDRCIEILNSPKLDNKKLDETLVALSILGNKEFNNKIVNSKLEVLGVYIPVLRQICKKVRLENIPNILNNIEFNYYEKTIIFALLLARLKDVAKIIEYLDDFVVVIDNWSTCDLMCSELKIVTKYKDKFLPKIKSYLNTDMEFIVRVGIILLMKYYIDEPQMVLNLIKNVDTSKYYIRYGVAWTLCEIYLKSPQIVQNVLKNAIFDEKTSNLAIQKICESLRVSKEEKQKIKEFRR